LTARRVSPNLTGVTSFKHRLRRKRAKQAARKKADKAKASRKRRR